jgi:transcriptional regulator with XRE-family HTH domain
MDYAQVRKDLGLSQIEMARLLDISVGSIRNWEQGTREPADAAVTLYKLVGLVGNKQEKTVLRALLISACTKKYEDIETARVVKGLIEKLLESELLRGVAEMKLLESNKHFKPEALGFRTTTILRR